MLLGTSAKEGEKMSEKSKPGFMTDKTLKFDIEALVAKVGGAFQLTVLIQKRMKELKSKLPKGTVEPKNLMEVICQEIMEDKIKLEFLPNLKQQQEENQSLLEMDID